MERSSSQLYAGMDGMGWDGMVIIGCRQCKSTFGAYKTKRDKGPQNLDNEVLRRIVRPPSDDHSLGYAHEH